MKMLKFSSMLVAVALFVAACGGGKETVETKDAEEVGMAEGTELTLDNAASQVMWVGLKGLGSNIAYTHQGTIDATQGTVTVKDGGITGGKFMFDLKTIECTDEGMEAEKKAGLTGHLLTSDFFGVYTKNEDGDIVDTVESNATITFEITGVKTYEAPAEGGDEADEWSTMNPTHTVMGNLTIKGITKNISFPANVSLSEGSVSAEAKFYIDRQKWNVSFMTGDTGLIEAGQDQYIMDEMGIGFNITANAPMADASM